MDTIAAELNMTLPLEQDSEIASGESDDQADDQDTEPAVAEEETATESEPADEVENTDATDDSGEQDTVEEIEGDAEEVSRS